MLVVPRADTPTDTINDGRLHINVSSISGTTENAGVENAARAKMQG